jgi:hypothetical protein
VRVFFCIYIIVIESALINDNGLQQSFKSGKPMYKTLLILLSILVFVTFLIDAPVQAIYCCEQDDTSTCAFGITQTRFYCFDTMAKCIAGPCDAGY